MIEMRWDIAAWARGLFYRAMGELPWHALPEHKALGVTNGLRKAIYDRISRVRHEMNATNRQEPRSPD